MDVLSSSSHQLQESRTRSPSCWQQDGNGMVFGSRQARLAGYRDRSQATMTSTKRNRSTWRHRAIKPLERFVSLTGLITLDLLTCYTRLGRIELCETGTTSPTDAEYLYHNVSGSSGSRCKTHNNNKSILGIISTGKHELR